MAGRLKYDYEQMVWTDAEGNVQEHPRYSKSPKSLDGKTFINSYIKAVNEGMKLNDFMKTNQAFPADVIQAKAKEIRSSVEALTSQAGKRITFPLLRKAKRPPIDKKATDALNAMLTQGMVSGALNHPAIKSLIESDPSFKKEVAE